MTAAKRQFAHHSAEGTPDQFEESFGPAAAVTSTGIAVSRAIPENGSRLAAPSAARRFTFTPRVRWIGRQFEDDENNLRLGEGVVPDLGVTRPLTKHFTLFLTLENLTDARVETGRSADGVVNVGTPRLLLGGVRGSW